jgi:hypothetical protein
VFGITHCHHKTVRRQPYLILSGMGFKMGGFELVYEYSIQNLLSVDTESNIGCKLGPRSEISLYVLGPFPVQLSLINAFRSQSVKFRISCAEHSCSGAFETARNSLNFEHLFGCHPRRGKWTVLLGTETLGNCSKLQPAFSSWAFG